MAEEQNVDLEQTTPEAQEEKTNKVEERFNKLSGKISTAEKSKEEAEAVAVEATANQVLAEKDRDFYKNFSEISNKYPGAGDFQDQIKEKVDAGMSLDDATVTIMHAEGRLTPMTQEVDKTEVVGGSAVTQNPDATKTVSEMTQEEKREELVNRNLSMQDLKKAGT